MASAAPAQPTRSIVTIPASRETISHMAAPMITLPASPRTMSGMSPYPPARESASVSHPEMSPPSRSIGSICTRYSDIFENLGFRLRRPRAGRVLAQGTHQDPAQGGPVARRAHARGPLDVARNAMHQVDAGDGHPHEGAARHGRSRHFAPLNMVRLMAH